MLSWKNLYKELYKYQNNKSNDLYISIGPGFWSWELRGGTREKNDVCVGSLILWQI